jgi:pSer/pThr/pTyr-binding forkhead associated (FHA) protein
MAEHPRLMLLPDGPHIEIDGDSLFLGRDCHLAATIPALKNKVVSNRHCCFKHEPDGHWTIEDLGSTNGTWLRGNRLAKREALVSGDVV